MTTKDQRRPLSHSADFWVRLTHQCFETSDDAIATTRKALLTPHPTTDYNMSASTTRNSGKTKVRRQDYFDKNENPSADRQQTKRPRSGDFRLHHRDSLPKWLIHGRNNTHSEESSRETCVGDTATNCSRVHREADTTNWHARIYVGNLPNHIGLVNAAYKELFAALYVTAFGALKPRQAAPVQSFWLHSCGRYGFLQMRGNKEAVNVMIFNGILLHGRLIRLSRPTGYRPAVKDLSAEEYVPDRIDGQRTEALVKALCGIIVAPQEQTYLAAIRPKVEVQEHAFIEKQTTSQGMDVERSDHDSATENIPTAQTENAGNVVAMLDLVMPISLENREEYEEVLLDVREELSRFGKVDSVAIPKTGEWAGTIFVQFEEALHAEHAVKGMTKRGFDGRKIKAYIVENCETAEEASKRLRVVA